MPLMLTRSDLQPLAEDDGALDAAIDAVEQSVLRSHAGEPGEAVFAGLRLANGDEFGTCFVASATGPASIRLFPHSHDGDRRNAWVGIQIDGRTGEIASLIALDDFNVLRTAVPAALGVRHLAPAGASTLTVLGSGTQARSHVRTFVRVMPHLKQVRIWSPTKEHRERFAAQMADSLGLEVTATDTIEAAVDGADVITATGRTQQRGQPALDDPTCVRPGALFVSMTSSGRNLVPLGARVVMPTARRPQLVAHGFSSGFFGNRPRQSHRKRHSLPTSSSGPSHRAPRRTKSSSTSWPPCISGTFPSSTGWCGGQWTKEQACPSTSLPKRSMRCPSTRTKVLCGISRFTGGSVILQLRSASCWTSTLVGCRANSSKARCSSPVRRRTISWASSSSGTWPRRRCMTCADTSPSSKPATARMRSSPGTCTTCSGLVGSVGAPSPPWPRKFGPRRKPRMRPRTCGRLPRYLAEHSYLKPSHHRRKGLLS